ncbi:LysR substrate-binding domain-containing protein, partial [Cohnella sp.]|uniref:LysR substrate-binding domain-containing protein n=1 Tax=Cohnella sp. TaxID=1883426 RepID=UPI00356B0AED
AGLGISLLSRWALRKELGLGSLKPLRAEGLPFRRSFHILSRRNDLRTRTVDAFLETLRAVTDEMLAEDNLSGSRNDHLDDGRNVNPDASRNDHLDDGRNVNPDASRKVNPDDDRNDNLNSRRKPTRNRRPN